MPVIVSEKGIKSKIKLGERVAVVENIKYPYFESEKHKKLCGRMNDFYSSVAEKYSFHARNRLPKRIKLARVTCKLPMVLAMNYTVALCNEDVVSVVLDLVFSQGKNMKMRRFSQLWSVKKCDMLAISDVLKKGSAGKLYSYVLTSAKKNGESGTFGYFDDYPLKLGKSFDIKNCFAVPKGLCFFVNAGILSPVKYGASNFILPFESIKDLIKDDFLPSFDKK